MYRLSYIGEALVLGVRSDSVEFYSNALLSAPISIARFSRALFPSPPATLNCPIWLLEGSLV